MSKYKKLPIVIEAKRFTEDTKDMVYSWAISIQQNVYHDWDKDGNPILKIPTMEVEMECSLGDYLVKEPFPTDTRKLYPCKPLQFAKTYISVDLKKERDRQSKLHFPFG